MKILSYTEWLSESKQEKYTTAIVTSPFLEMEKGDVVKVDALQYTKGGNEDVLDILTNDGKKLSIQKKFLDVKI